MIIRFLRPKFVGAGYAETRMGTYGVASIFEPIPPIGSVGWDARTSLHPLAGRA
jgi:hypothetical protein